ncbi:histidine kinase [Cognataquiflexum rubidum]|uniref:sensor histidine kinase n=1 Tax=Cognataquiflexum rubidum TaxID=2922273 RepID=UPI001F1379A1|nr:histidine kinase [Cognataquiflexum rubidum]MCH6234223.1 histidine kinase [Cognataquiflexum rubidum]
MVTREKVAMEVFKLLDIVSDGILILDNQVKILYLNKVAAFFLGIDQEKALDQEFLKLAIDPQISGLVHNYKSDKSTSSIEIHVGEGEKQSWIELKIYGKDEYVIVCFRDISARKEGEEKYKMAYESIRFLNSHSQKIKEEERTLLSREIHDQLGQRLTGMKMEVDFILKKSSNLDDFAKEKLQGVLKQIERTVSTIRNISRSLRPGILDDFGLLAALEWQAEEFKKTVQIPVFFQYGGKEKPIENQKATAIFRVFQECLTNIMRHSQCSHVKVEIDFGPMALKLMIVDNGSGFDTKILNNTKSLGILGMKERAESFGGSFDIQSSPGDGTKTILTMPY